MKPWIEGYLQKTAIQNPFSAVPSAADMTKANVAGAKAYAPTQARLKAAKPNIVITSGDKRLEMRSPSTPAPVVKTPTPAQAPVQTPVQLAQAPAQASTWNQDLARIGGETRRFVNQAAAGNWMAPIQQ